MLVKKLSGGFNDTAPRAGPSASKASDKIIANDPRRVVDMPVIRKREISTFWPFVMSELLPRCAAKMGAGSEQFQTRSANETALSPLRFRCVRARGTTCRLLRLARP